MSLLRRLRPAALLVATLLLTACAHLPGLERETLQALADEVGRAHAPDKRLALWDVRVQDGEKGPVLVGHTDQEQALAALHERLARTGRTVALDVTVLPQPGTPAAQTPWALVSVPTATILTRPAFAASTTTQALLGTPLRVLEFERPFWRVQTPDGYIGWVHSLQIERISGQALGEWNASELLVTVGRTAQVTDETGRVLLPLPELSVVRLVGQTKAGAAVRLPDGRQGLVRVSDLQSLTTFEENRQALREGDEKAFHAAFVREARSWLGTPYLWGGTSEAGLDCSGFVSLVWRSLGVIAARDADQQIAQATPVAVSSVRDLQPGSLLAFGRKDKAGRIKVEHIGISLGKGEFLHSLGSVRIESLDPTSSIYSAYEAGRFLGAYRLDPTLTNVPCATTLRDNPFYAQKPGLLTPCRLPAIE